MDIFFSNNVHQCDITFSVMRVPVCFLKSSFIFYYISSLPASVAANSVKRICAFGLFVRMTI